MPNINPDLHEYGYVFVPSNRVTALFSSTSDAKMAVGELQGLGIEAAAIDVFVGPEGADTLDLPALKQSCVVRLLRNFESLMVQVAGQTHEQADAALRAGGVAIAVLLEGHQAMRDAIAAVLRKHAGKAIRHWGRWSIEVLD